MEERRGVRRRAAETASSLSVPRGDAGQFYAGVRFASSGAQGFEGEYPRRARPPVSPATICPLGQPNKGIGHESPLEPWLAYRHRASEGASVPLGTNANDIGIACIPLRH